MNNTASVENKEQTINDYIDLYKLYVETGSYYKNYRPLNYYYINIFCNLKDLKIILIH